MADFPKDFNLQTMDLTNSEGRTLNLRFVFLELNVYEDIWNNNVTASIVVNDANNLLTNFPMFGFETLTLEFQTPDKTMWSKTLRLTGITNRKLEKERQMVYVLHFVTPEAISNLKQRVSKSYVGKLYSEIVEDLHNNWLGGGPIEVETSKFPQHFVVPRLHPVHAINMICSRANPSAYNGANYLYYEDGQKFRFVTMESRLAQNASQKYLFQPANVRQNNPEAYKPRDINSDILAVQVYTFDNHSDIVENLGAGMYGNELLTHSQVLKEWQSYTFDYQGSFDDYKHLYQSHPLYSKAKPDLGSPNSKLKLFSTGHGPYQFLPEQWIPVRISQLQQLHNIRLTVTVPGDSDRLAGQVVEFMLPSPEAPLDNQQIDDKFYKGRYLVSSLRHKIDPNTYVTTMELIKDSVFEAYP
jgi:hypothetical protein